VTARTGIQKPVQTDPPPADEVADGIRGEVDARRGFREWLGLLQRGSATWGSEDSGVLGTIRRPYP